MPIRYVDQRSAVGRISAALESFTSSVVGAHEAPPVRTGSISAGMQPFTASMAGSFQPEVHRTGTIAVTLGGFTSSVQGTFTPSTVDSFPRFAYYGIGGTAPGRRYDSEAFLNASPRFRFIIGAIWPAWFVGKTYDFTEVCQEIHTRSNGRTEVFLYQIYESIHKSAANASDAQNSLYDLINDNGLWAFTNGLTETGQVDSYNSAYFQNNHSNAGKLVGGKRQYQLAIDWYLSWEVNGATVNGVAHPPNTALDGDFFDNVFPYFKNPAADMDRNGVLDNYSSAASIALAQASHVAAIDYIRTLRPGKKLLGNTAEWIFAASIAAYIGKFDGGVIEGGIGQSYSHETSVNFKAYIDYIHFNVNAYADPKWGCVVNILDSLTNYALMRYGYTATALTNGYCHHSRSSLSCDDMATVASYDEYQFNLGQPVAGPDGAPQTTARYFAAADGSGVWRRDFTNGIVLCAARRGTGAVGSSSLTAYGSVALGGTFYRLGAPLDPVWNNGAAITAITMIPRTGIVLSRTPYDRIPPSVPSSFAVAAVTSLSVTLSWNASTDTGGSGLAGYKIERSPNGTSGWSEIAQPTVTSYPNAGLTPSTQYFYRARAYDNAGNHSGYTSVISATTSAASATGITLDSGYSGSGVFAEGQTFTLTKSGGGFGPAPTIIIFEDFSGGTPGQVVDLAATIGSWSALGGNQPIYSSIANSGSVGMRANLPSNVSKGAARQLLLNFPSTSEIFLTYHVRSNQNDTSWVRVGMTGTNTSSGQAKLAWLMQDQDGYNQLTKIDMVWPSWTSGRWYVAGNDGFHDSAGLGNGRVLANQWSRFAMWAKYNGVGVPMTYFTQWVTPNAHVIDTTPDNDSRMFMGTSSTGYNRLNIPGYTEIDAELYLDDIYAATSPARVEVGDAATYTACRKLYVLPHTAWADGAISVEPRRGGHPSLSGTHLYVTNASNVTSHAGVIE